MKIERAIVNTDLDGLLSGLLLHHFLGTEIVGFCDSGEYVWKKEGVAWEDCTFIDMYVPLSGIDTYCNHMIAVDKQHAKTLFGNPHKNNPNVDISTRYFLGEYPRKFALSTFFYLVALLEEAGFCVSRDLILRNKVEGFRCIDVILRADDVANITLNTYRENALFWWRELIERSQGGECLSVILTYLNKIHSEELPFNMYSFKERFFRYVKYSFGCETPDGGYKGLTFANSHLHLGTKHYIHFLSELTGLNCFPLDISLRVFKGKAQRADLSLEDLEEIRTGSFRGKVLFSYAFVSMPSSPNHFSCTYDLKKV